MELVDTNIWLERLLDQDRSEEVGRFLESRPSNQLFITDFALHSIGLALSRLGQLSAFAMFVREMFIDGAAGLVRLEAADLLDLTMAIQQFGLDFDHAYQYVAAKKHGLTLVSFDGDFDRTDVGRKTPGELVP